jgi:hypothetical protein
MGQSAHHIFLGALALVALLYAGCGSPVEVFLDCPSPDGQYIATFFLIQRGGTPGALVTRLILHRVQERWQTDAAFLELAGGYDVRVTWLGARRLRVEFPDDARPQRAEPVAWVGERFEVTYAPVPGNKGLLMPAGSVCLRGPPVS